MQSKDRYVQQLHTHIDRWSATIDEMEAKAKKLQADTRLTYEKQLAQLRAELDNLKTKFAELKQASGDTWDAVKQSLETGVDTFKANYERLRRERRELTESGTK